MRIRILTKIRLKKPRIFHGFRILGILADFRIRIADFRIRIADFRIRIADFSNIFIRLFLNKKSVLTFAFSYFHSSFSLISSRYSGHLLNLS